jgi:hypothetical protein
MWSKFNEILQIVLGTMAYRVRNYELTLWARWPSVHKPHSLQFVHPLHHSKDPMYVRIGWCMCVCFSQSSYAAKKDAEGRGWQQRSLVKNELKTSSKGRETHKLPVRLSKSNESHCPRQDSHSDNSHDRKCNFL